jgi:ureidoglycolate dehydrogenase (NAD+)
MPQVQYESLAVDHRELAVFCGRLFVAAGLRPDDAEVVADSLVESDLRGISSHGVARIPHYLERIRLGGIHPQPQITTTHLGPTSARIDGNHGLGQLAMCRATQTAIELAQTSGAGWATVCNSSHCGALAYYGLKIADAGMIGLVFTHVDPMVVPYGAKKAFCGTNPICITAPRAPSGAYHGSTGAICLDMATSKAPWNAVANAAREGVAIPDGWAIDDDGNATTDPNRVAAMLPFGEYKGSGLGIMIDVLCSLLSDSPFGPDIPKMYSDDLSQKRRLGGMVGAIDIGRFVPLDRFYGRACDLVTRLGALPPAAPDGEILFPGEPELRQRERRVREGIPIGIQTLEALNQLAARFGLPKIASSAERPACSM